MEGNLLTVFSTGMQTWWIQFHRESNIEQYINENLDVRGTVNSAGGFSPKANMMSHLGSWQDS